MADETTTQDTELESLKESFENFLTVTEIARQDSERDVDYDDHKQWTDKEVTVLKARNQAPVVINRIKTKVNLLTGVQRKFRTDPKALPRTQEHEEAADAATEALRFVADNQDFQQTSSSVFKNQIVWGYGGAIVEPKEVGGEIEVAINRIPSDRYYFDPHSRELDFSDKKFDGICIWMDVDDAKTAFPGNDEAIEASMGSRSDLVDGSTFEDRPLWIDRKRKRIRVCQHFYKKAGVWHLAYFTGEMFLIEPHPSPYLDEFGEPDNPIEVQTLYIDRDNCRYGEVRGYIWTQDEINHRRSKMLHNLSTRQVVYEKGAVDDINIAKKELAKADGGVEVNPDMRFELLDNTDVTSGQFQLYQEAKGEIDTVGANAALSGTTAGESLSGRALQALQQGGIAELGALFDGHKSWERRVYRQCWNRIKQYWDAERWIRVTDNEDNLKWVGLNQPVTLGQQLQEAAQQGDERAQAMLQQSIDDPRLNEVVETKNNVAELDIDIMLAESPDYATLRGEQFEKLASLAQAYGPEAVPFEVMLRLSDMTNKDEVMELLKPDEEDQAQIAAQTEIAAAHAEEELEAKTLGNELTATKIEEGRQNIIQKSVETQQLAQVPADSVNVSV